jgi:hypothetical protein
MRAPPISPTTFLVHPEHVALGRKRFALSPGHARHRAVGRDSVPNQTLVRSGRYGHDTDATWLRQRDRSTKADVPFDLMSQPKGHTAYTFHWSHLGSLERPNRGTPPEALEQMTQVFSGIL